MPFTPNPRPSGRLPLTLNSKLPAALLSARTPSPPRAVSLWPLTQTRCSRPDRLHRRNPQTLVNRPLTQTLHTHSMLSRPSRHTHNPPRTKREGRARICLNSAWAEAEKSAATKHAVTTEAPEEYLRQSKSRIGKAKVYQGRRSLFMPDSNMQASTADKCREKEQMHMNYARTQMHAHNLLSPPPSILSPLSRHKLGARLWRRPRKFRLDPPDRPLIGAPGIREQRQGRRYARANKSIERRYR